MAKEQEDKRDTYFGHAGDCTIRTSLNNVSVGPAAGICICGYGYRIMREEGGSTREMYSRELVEVMEEKSRKELAGAGEGAKERAMEDLRKIWRGKEE